MVIVVQNDLSVPTYGHKDGPKEAFMDRDSQLPPTDAHNTPTALGESFLF